MQCTLLNILMGYFIGCMFGVGCASAVLHTIYIGGYRKAACDAMLDEKPRQFLKAVEFNRRHAGKGLTIFGLFKLNESYERECPMRGNVKKKVFSRPLPEREHDGFSCIQPDL